MLVHDAINLDVILPLCWVQGWKCKAVVPDCQEHLVSYGHIRVDLSKREREGPTSSGCASFKHVPSAFSTLANPTGNPHIRALAPRAS
jgi:hypothetical protein